MTPFIDKQGLGSRVDRDAVTAALFVEGDPQGLRQLLEDYGGVVRERLRRKFSKVLDDSELDEAMALTAIRVWQSAASYDAGRGSLRAWVSVIATNCALKMLGARARRGHELRPDLDGWHAPGAAASATTGRQRLLADAHACLQKLPGLQREVLLADLRAGGAAPAAELAKRLGTSANSIYVSRNKGLERLRQKLRVLGYGKSDDQPDLPAHFEMGS